MKIQTLIDAEEQFALAQSKLAPKFAKMHKLRNELSTVENQIDKVLNPLQNKISKAIKLQCLYLSPWIHDDNLVGLDKLNHFRYKLGSCGEFVPEWWSRVAWLRYMCHRDEKWKITLDYKIILYGGIENYNQIIIPDNNNIEEILNIADQALVQGGWQLS